jgi:NAD(P)-dependent dehydrogenase (short-subunit alcohol dehydrogenase family)
VNESSVQNSGNSGLLAGKVLLIAGLGPQMGAATALVAAREGAQVALAARSPETSGAVADVIRASGGSAMTLQCDFSIDDQVRGAVDATLAELGRIDCVFYNAGFTDHQHGDLEIDESVWQQTMDINLRGAMSVARYAVPSMLEHGGGAFVFNSSDNSLVAEDVRLGYAVSKAGLNAVTRFVASRYGRQGIRANAILPFVAAGDSDMGAAASSLNCLGRPGTANEIAEVVVFLCSERAAVITGQLIHLDGGLMVRAPWPSIPLQAQATLASTIENSTK